MQNGEVMVVEVTHQMISQLTCQLPFVSSKVLLSANFYAAGKYTYWQYNNVSVFNFNMSSRCCGVRAYSLSHCLTQFSSYLLSDSEVVYSQVGPTCVRGLCGPLWVTDSDTLIHFEVWHCDSLTVTHTDSWLFCLPLPTFLYFKFRMLPHSWVAR